MKRILNVLEYVGLVVVLILSVILYGFMPDWFFILIGVTSVLAGAWMIYMARRKRFKFLVGPRELERIQGQSYNLGYVAGVQAMANAVLKRRLRDGGS